MIMEKPIDFYFDFSSPYGYMAAQKIDALAAKYGRAVSRARVDVEAIGDDVADRRNGGYCALEALRE